MAIPVARVHLKVAHAALPALLPTPTPPKSKILPLFSTPPFVAAILPKPLAKPGRADADERWDAHKAKTACPASSASPSSEPRSAGSIKSSINAETVINDVDMEEEIVWKPRAMYAGRASSSQRRN